MQVIINGIQHIIPEQSSITDALLHLGYEDTMHFAVAVDHHVIARTAHANTRLCDGQIIEILSPMQGG